MKEHIFEPCIYFDNKIKCVKDIILDHKFDYEYLNNGVNINGDITLSFNVEDDFEIKPASIKQNVELFIALNEIDSLKEITLEVEDFSYLINENELKFKVFTKLKGNKEDFVFFELSPSQKVNKEAIALLMRNVNEETLSKTNISQDTLKRFEELIKSSAVDLIASSSDEIICEDDIIEFSTLDEEVKDVLDVNVEEVKEEEEIHPIYIKEEVKELKIDREKNVKEEKDELLKETYTSSFFFYVLKERETKLDVINKFKMNEDKFDELNKNIIFKKGTLVRIPK